MIRKPTTFRRKAITDGGRAFLTTSFRCGSASASRWWWKPLASIQIMPQFDARPVNFNRRIEFLARLGVKTYRSHPAIRNPAGQQRTQIATAPGISAKQDTVL